MIRSHIFRGIRFYSNAQQPLDILFFGSDTFSIHSYKTLQQISLKQPNLISKLQLVTRPPKWCGRKKSILKKPEILKYIESQTGGQPLLCDTRQDMLDSLIPWLAKSQNSMLIAVSYGKLIPSELIDTANYSLNVHPSLLPRYKGSAPIQHTLLNNDSVTGVSIQTLDPIKFDNGEIIARTPEIDVQNLLQSQQEVERVPGYMTRIMIDQLGKIGSELLGDVIQSGTYINHSPLSNLYKPSWATTIKTNDKQILWFKYTADYISRMIGILGPVFTFKKTQVGKVYRSNESFTEKRVLIHDVTAIKWPSQDLLPGQFQFDSIANVIRVGCAENTQLEIRKLQFEACAIETSDEFIRKLKKRCGSKAAEQMCFN